MISVARGMLAKETGRTYSYGLDESCKIGSSPAETILENGFGKGQLAAAEVESLRFRRGQCPLELRIDPVTDPLPFSNALDDARMP